MPPKMRGPDKEGRTCQPKFKIDKERRRSGPPRHEMCLFQFQATRSLVLVGVERSTELPVGREQKCL